MYKTFLFLHVFSGSLGLLTGLIAMLQKKGTQAHNRSGRYFAWTMGICSVLALCLSILKFNPFLLAIALFTLYLLQAGLRSIQLWRKKELTGPSQRDYLPIAIGLPVATFMIAFPIYLHYQHNQPWSPILPFFGLIMLVLIGRDFQLLKKTELWKPFNPNWQKRHLGMMGGTYIASVTAFLVNTVHFQPGWILWMAPSLVGIFFIRKSIAGINKSK